MENEVSRTIDVSQWKLIRDRKQVSEGESILNTYIINMIVCQMTNYKIFHIVRCYLVALIV
jgi:hypothetical protein